MSELPEIEISTSPFFSDLLGSPVQSEAPASTARGRENRHLLDVMTAGSRPPLHIVDEGEAPIAEADHAVGSLQEAPSRARRREVTQIRPVGFLHVDWTLVRTLTRELEITDDTTGRPRSSFDVAVASAAPETQAEERTWAQIERIIERRSTSDTAAKGADHDWSESKRAHYAQAIFDQAHRYGRISQYLREPDIEDVSAVGFNNVVVTKTDGAKQKRAPIADSDKDLEDMIAEIASYRGRTFAKPSGHIDLDIGGARLSATGVGITSATNLTLRMHNLVDVTLDDMVRKRTISAKMAEFLAAASRAHRCIFVAGYPSAGKTTMLRALASTLPAEEKVATIETEHELYLGKVEHRHWQVQDLQYVPPQSAGADSIAGFTLAKCLDMALRASAQVILFAEIKSIEGPIALQAMEAGRASMSTIHARSADDAIHRFADVLMGELGLSSDVVPLRQISRCIDLILYIDFIENPDGTRRRVVTEVAEVVPNDAREPMAALLFEYDPDLDDWTNPDKPSTRLAKPLRRVGYDWNKEVLG